MVIGIILFVVGFLAMFYAFLSYKRVDRNLSAVKEEDLVSYYLELSYQMLPAPFWSAVLGAVSFLIGLVVVLVKLPVVF